MTVDVTRLTSELEEVLGWPEIACTPMAGATSAALFAVVSPAGEAVVRIFDEARWDTPAATLSDRELKILKALAGGAPATPEPRGRLAGNGVIMSRLPGAVALPEAPGSDWLQQLAGALTRIHERPSKLPWRYESWNAMSSRTAPDWWQDGGVWADALACLAEPPAWEGALIHRDYHPTNVLWERGQVTGVVDWINACEGPASVDVAHCRLNLAIMYGPPAADAFLSAYGQHRPGFRHHAYWDIDDAFSALPDPKPYAPWSEFGLAPLQVDTVRERLEAFVAAALRTA